MSNAICVSCGSDKVEIIRVKKNLSYYRCRICKHCELVLGTNIRNAFESAQKKYFSQSLHSLENINDDQDADINNKRISIVKKWLPINSDIIEIGPGFGVFAMNVRSFGYNISLVEHSKEISDLLKVKYDFTVYNGEFEKLSVKFNTFDAFCSFHVLEHVVDPVEHLRLGLNCVHSGGFAFIATPNSQSWQQRLFPKLSPNFDSAHLRVYSPLSLKKDCQDAGWEVLEIHYPEYLSGWFRVFTKTIRRVRGEDEEATAGKYAGSKTKIIIYIIKLIGMLSMPLRLLQSELKGGNEIFIILKKPVSNDKL